MQTPSRDNGVRPLYKNEEIAVVMAGLQLDQDERNGQELEEGA